MIKGKEKVSPLVINSKIKLLEKLKEEFAKLSNKKVEMEER